MSKIVELDIPFRVVEMLHYLKGLGLVPYLVGGTVRDHLLHSKVKDYDIEVFGIECMNKLLEVLSKKYKIKQVGKAYMVLKVLLSDELVVDCSIPRVDSHFGKRHSDVTVSYTQDIRKAISRRDFSINSIYARYINSKLFEIVDLFGGLQSIKNKSILITSYKTFFDDPLRILRGVKFACRYNFSLDKRLFETLSRPEFLNDLSFDRIREEMTEIGKYERWGEIIKKMIKSGYRMEIASCLLPDMVNCKIQKQDNSHPSFAIVTLCKMLTRCKKLPKTSDIERAAQLFGDLPFVRSQKRKILICRRGKFREVNTRLKWNMFDSVYEYIEAKRVAKSLGINMIVFYAFKKVFIINFLISGK